MEVALVVAAAVVCVSVVEVGRRAVSGRRLEHAFDDMRPLGSLDGALRVPGHASAGSTKRRAEQTPAAAPGAEGALGSVHPLPRAS